MPDDIRTQRCHAHELFGAWACEPERLGRMVEVINGRSLSDVLARVDVRAGAEATDGPAPTQRKLYQVHDGIAVVDLNGPMTKYPSSFQAMFGGTSTLMMRRALRDAVADRSVDGVLIRIDSPGGTVAGTHDLADDVGELRTRKPIWAAIDDLGASAAYCVACRAERVVANRNALVGSIGTMVVLRDTSRAADEIGVKVHVVASGPLKGTGVPGTPITDAQLADVQRMVDSLFGQFRADVMHGRRMDRERADAVSTGQLWVAEDALTHGLIDEIASAEAAIRSLRARVGRSSR
ncbi:MAG: S49 family peptidase [Pirellulales bacterium]|nr:S49 family peptidase [Pirellulales bacterium]